jgi:hypothetical protein
MFVIFAAAATRAGRPAPAGRRFSAAGQASRIDRPGDPGARCLP